MNPYDIVMQHLRDAGFNYDALADLTARNALPVQVINVRRDSKDGRVLFTQHTPGNTVVVFQGLQVILDRLVLLIDRDIARDWGL